MADVTMTYAALETAANNINTAKADLDSVIAQLTSAVLALEGQYSGQSYEAFVNAWQTSKPTMEKLSQAVADFSTELTRTVANQIETEGGAVTRMNSLGF